MHSLFVKTLPKGHIVSFSLSIKESSSLLLLIEGELFHKFAFIIVAGLFAVFRERLSLRHIHKGHIKVLG